MKHAGKLHVHHKTRCQQYYWPKGSIYWLHLDLNNMAINPWCSAGHIATLNYMFQFQNWSCMHNIKMEFTACFGLKSYKMYKCPSSQNLNIYGSLKINLYIYHITRSYGMLISNFITKVPWQIRALLITLVRICSMSLNSSLLRKNMEHMNCSSILLASCAVIILIWKLQVPVVLWHLINLIISLLNHTFAFP